MQADAYLLKLEVGSLPGVGGSTRHKLEAIGIHRVADLRLSSLEALQQELGGKNGALVWWVLPLDLQRKLDKKEKKENNVLWAGGGHAIGPWSGGFVFQNPKG